MKYDYVIFKIPLRKLPLKKKYDNNNNNVNNKNLNKSNLLNTVLLHSFKNLLNMYMLQIDLYVVLLLGCLYCIFLTHHHFRSLYLSMILF